MSPPRASVRNSHINIHRIRKIVFQEAKSDDLNQEIVCSEPTRHSTIIQQQPTQTTTWVKSSSSNSIRPELNWAATSKWSHGVCSISEDWNMCCYACACWCCFRHEISTMMGEHWCLWFVNCTPLMQLRTKFRQQYSIQVKIFILKTKN